MPLKWYNKHDNYPYKEREQIDRKRTEKSC